MRICKTRRLKQEGLYLVFLINQPHIKVRGTSISFIHKNKSIQKAKQVITDHYNTTGYRALWAMLCGVSRHLRRVPASQPYASEPILQTYIHYKYLMITFRT